MLFLILIVLWYVMTMLETMFIYKIAILHWLLDNGGLASYNLILLSFGFLLYSNFAFLRTKENCTTLRSYKLNPKNVLISCRFINREGIDFSDAQSMQAIQVCKLNVSEYLSFVTLFTYEFMINFFMFLGVGFGGKFAGSLRIPDEVHIFFFPLILARNFLYISFSRHIIDVFSLLFVKRIIM